MAEAQKFNATSNEPTDVSWSEVSQEAIAADLAASLADSDIDPATLQDVDVQTEKLEGRQRQITAKILVPHPAEQIWQILTDYDHLSDFIPNLAKSQRIQHPGGGIRIEQVGTQCLLNFKFCARVVLDMVEQFPHQLNFQMVEGDFKQFSGSWILQPAPMGTQMGTNLQYTVLVCPPRIMPVNLIERRLSQNLAINLASIKQRAEDLFGVR